MPDVSCGKGAPIGSSWASTAVGIISKLISLSIIVYLFADGTKCWGQAGELDPTFDPGAGANGAVRSLYLTADGHVYIGGDFTTFDGRNSSLIARLNSNGSLDSSFSSRLPSNGIAFSLVQLSDGTVIVVGSTDIYYPGT